MQHSMSQGEFIIIYKLTSNLLKQVSNQSLIPAYVFYVVGFSVHGGKC